MVNNGIFNLINNTNQAQNALNSQVPLTQSQAQLFSAGGIPAGFSGDANGLPYAQVPSYKQAQLQRNIITWYVPQFGTVRMYVNPAAISYTHKKLISKDRTKGGYTLQYWGEDLSVLGISGTTGSAGIEGIEALYQVYRAEQYAFDAVALNLAGNNAAMDMTNNVIGGAGAALGNQVNQLFGGSPNSPTAASSGAGILGGILSLSGPSTALSIQNIPTLAQLACTVQMYYAGMVYQGYFESMTINEQANDFLLNYTMQFVVTQTSGYRYNRFGWERSANNGPSQPNSPYSWSGHVDVGQ